MTRDNEIVPRRSGRGGTCAGTPVSRLANAAPSAPCLMFGLGRSLVLGLVFGLALMLAGVTTNNGLALAQQPPLTLAVGDQEWLGQPGRITRTAVGRGGIGGAARARVARQEGEEAARIQRRRGLLQISSEAKATGRDAGRIGCEA